MNLHDAANRVSAYVYGNVVTFATLVSLTRDDASNGRGVVVLAGVAASTFCAHVLADSIGRRMRLSRPLRFKDLRHELRDSVPILTSAVVPMILLLFATLAVKVVVLSQILAASYLITRLASVGILIAWLRGEKSSWRMILAGVGLAAVGAAVSAFKIVAGH